MKRVLHIKAGEVAADSLARAQRVMEALQAGEPVTPYYGAGFASAAQALAVFTPRRLELLAALREQGPLRVAELARLLGRDYKNVHGDVAALEEWLAVERAEDGRVAVPWDEIDVRLSLVKEAA